MFSKYFMRCLKDNTNVFNLNGISRRLTDIFHRKVNKTTFLNNDDGDFQIHSDEEQTSRHSIDQTYITYSCIPGEFSSKVTHSHFIPHLAFHFQRRSLVTKKGRAKPSGFKTFPGCIITQGWLGCLVLKELLKSVPDKKLTEYLWWESLVFSKVSCWRSATLLKLNFFAGIFFYNDMQIHM